MVFSKKSDFGMKFLAKLEVKVLKAQFRIQGFELGLLQIIYLK